MDMKMFFKILIFGVFIGLHGYACEEANMILYILSCIVIGGMYGWEVR